MNDLLDLEAYRYYRNNPVAFIKNALGVILAHTQRRILEAIRDHRRVLIISGNGVGKSYTVAGGILWWFLTRPDSIALLTSGSYSQMEDTTWRPMKSLLAGAKWPLAGVARPLDSKPPRIEMPEPEWYMKGVSPNNPDGLEGRHNAECLVVIEEADKPEVTAETFDSAGSSITDAGDRIVAIANPPRNEANVVYEKMQSDRWHVVNFSSFESHNVLIDTGEIDGDYIPGIVTLDLIAEDWEEWNRRSWPNCSESVSEMMNRVNRGEITRDRMIKKLLPGFKEAKEAHLNDQTLSERWYRRRAGIMPPAHAGAHRPFYPNDVKAALERPLPPSKGPLLGIGFDIARQGGDSCVCTKLYEKVVEQITWNNTDHNENESRCRNILKDEPDNTKSCMDAVGEGSGTADKLNQSHGTIRFQAGTKPDQDKEYDNQWTEGVVRLSKRLDRLCLDGCSNRLREQLLVASRVIEFEEKRKRSGDVLKATPKEKLKETLGYSPDELDSLVMAAWVADHQPKKRSAAIGLGF